MFSTENFFGDSTHKSTIFSPAQIDFLETNAYTKIVRGKSTPFIKCLVRGKEIRLTPEEAVRQMFIRKLIDEYGYSTAQMTVEHPIHFGREVKRADIVIFERNRPTVEYIIVEVKKPKLKDGKEQLKSYCHATGATMGVWTNGEKISFYQRKEPNYFEDIPDIPHANQKLKDILRERRTIANLIAEDKLLRENKTLADLILELEDEVLANAGVDVFEEVFKLIYTKLFDEMLSGRDKNRVLEFWNYGETDADLKDTIQNLFDRAKDKWQGIFADDDKIKLTPSHLAICVSSLQNVKLFNSNLDVIDDAFEYLMSKSQKGEKGQFFTPRYVIDMCVRMLNPKVNETMIDTAAGSCGFPVHTTFYVWKKILDERGLSQSHLFSLERKPPECEDYVGRNVFAIDFDEKTVRVARTLNLIAGDGRTNVLHLNTIDYERWDETIDDDWREIYFNGWVKLCKLRAVKNDNSKFNFDIVMANPPFAGDIKESRIIAKYELGKNSKGKYQSKVGRDILFIERNLNFLKPGGRMAIVLPQGRFNNSSDKYIRDFIAERCRILAVVGLHGNVFKPHTGTKTSVLFVQKWDDKLCPRRDDYPIFFATMREPSKDNSGEKIFETSGGKFLRDKHNHTIVKHDLFNHDGLTRDGIAEAFIEFAKRERLSFFEQGSFDAENYRRLSEELECTEINFSYVSHDIFRLDSFFYAKEFLAGEKLIAQLQTTSLREMKRATILSFGAYSLNNFVEYLSEGVPFIRCVDMKGGVVDTENLIHISAAAHKLLYKSEVFPETVLLSMSGSVGNVALASPSWKYPINSNQDIAKIRLRGEMNPYYFYAFFASKYGQNYMRREARGSVQQHVFLSQIEKFRIPVPSDKFAVAVEKICKSGFDFKERADENYHAAEKTLSEALGLENFTPSSENVAIKTLSASFGLSGRLDAEFYQPKYDDIESKIFEFDPATKKLSEVAEYIFTGEYSEEYHEKNSAPNLRYYIRGTDINNGRIIRDDAHCVIKTGFSKFVSAGDILTGRVGTIGNFGVVDKSLDGAVCSDNIICFRLPPNYNPNVYAMYFNHPLIKDLCKKLSRGTVQQRLNQETLTDLPLPVVARDVQEKIAAQIAESFRLRGESEKLLSRAKKSVELAIEHGEDYAINFLA